ncbi:hypothetical protein MBLNU459_g6868t1 [Dothideomycetes sp. NU459]
MVSRIGPSAGPATFVQRMLAEASGIKPAIESGEQSPARVRVDAPSTRSERRPEVGYAAAKQANYEASTSSTRHPAKPATCVGGSVDCVMGGTDEVTFETAAYQGNIAMASETAKVSTAEAVSIMQTGNSHATAIMAPAPELAVLPEAALAATTQSAVLDPDHCRSPKKVRMGPHRKKITAAQSEVSSNSVTPVASPQSFGVPGLTSSPPVSPESRTQIKYEASCTPEAPTLATSQSTQMQMNSKIDATFGMKGGMPSTFTFTTPLKGSDFPSADDREGKCPAPVQFKLAGDAPSGTVNETKDLRDSVRDLRDERELLNLVLLNFSGRLEALEKANMELLQYVVDLKNRQQ